MSAEDFAAWGDELGQVTVPLGDIAAVSTIHAGTAVLVVITVPIPAGLAGDRVRSSLTDSVSRSASIAGAAVRGYIAGRRDAGDPL